jgi:hypothetical protein
MARHLFENDINPTYLELPFSKICDSDEFLLFFLHITENIDTFSKIYNDKLDSYRKRNKIRNKINPLPDLIIKENLIELPFWTWRTKEFRKKLYLKNENKLLYLYSESFGKFFFIDKNNPKIYLKLKDSLRKKEIKIRPKALMLTLYNRLFIADLFIHGIGGIKYDIVTNDIIEEFFKVKPPHCYSISTTFLLDLRPFQPPSHSDLPLLRKKLRDLHFNPEKISLEINLKKRDENQVRQFIERKHELINMIKKSSLINRKKELSEVISNINLQIKEKLKPYETELKEKLVLEEKKGKQLEIHNFREFPFCFFSVKELRELINF